MKKRLLATATAMLGLATLGLAPTQGQTGSQATQWLDWGGDAARTHFSPLKQINASNVAELKPAWVWDGGTFGRSWEITPLLIDGLLYISEAGSSDVIALQPETGKEVWRYKAPAAGRGLDRRGFAYWGGDGTMKPRLVVLWGHIMYGLDLKTGKPSGDWPATGLDIGLPNPANGNAISGGVSPASPPIIYKNLIITTSATGFQPGAQPSDPHANDLRTGKLVWTARLIPNPGEPGGDSWGPAPQEIAGSGSWGILALDEKTGTVYVPTDSGNPDYSGIWRPGDNINSDATVALDAATGKFKWGFQNHHHDIFDLDTNSAPSPVEITRNGRRTKVIVQTTKQGMLWILDAATGKPIFPYEERPVKQSQVPGEKSSPTQPFTILPAPLSKATLQRDNLSQLSDQANAECKALYDANKLEDAGPFNPPRPGGAWTAMPIGAIGGVDWGGASVDLDRGYAMMNIVNLPTMITIGQGPGGVKGNDGYRPTSGNVRFADNDGRSCNGGRQGELAAVNLATGQIVWQVPLGSLEDVYGERAKDMGATSIGATLATRGGIVFAAATDDRLHAYDTRTGKLLWQMKMAATANSSPMTFIGKDGRQYVVVAAGGPGNARRPSLRESGVYHQTMVAFALPKAGETPPDIVTPYPRRALGPNEKMLMFNDSGDGRIVPAGP